MAAERRGVRRWKTRVAIAAAGVPRQRLPQFFGLTIDPASALGNFSIAIIGLGSVGWNIADRVARLRPGRMLLVDRGRFKPESMETHSITPRQASGRKPKAGSAARHCSAISPGTEIAWFDGPVQLMDYSEFVGADLVVLATDNLTVEVFVSQMCISLGKALLHAAVHGESLVAQVRTYANHPDGPCLRCHYSSGEEAMVQQNTILSCTGGATEFGKQTVPTMSTASLCAVAADLAAINILRVVLRLGEPLVDQQIEFSGYTNRTVISPLPVRNPKCRADHSRWRVHPQSRPLADCTLDEIASASGLAEAGGLDGVSFSIPGRQFVEMADCSRCGPCRLRMFTGATGELPPCPRCRGPLAAQPFFSEEAIAAAHLKELVDLPLRKLGVREAASILIRRNDATVLVHRHQPGSKR